jgi:predicted DNA-binding transcriptional regulator AlpA
MAGSWKLQAWPARLSEELAAAYLSVGRSTFRLRVSAGTYPQPVREGGRVYWSKVQLDRFISGQFGYNQSLVMEDNTWVDLR